MSNSEFKPKKGDFFHKCLDFIFGFENKKGEVLDYWISIFDNFSFPPQEFYAAITKELEARKVPSLTISKIDFAQGGILAENRVYLRLLRERLALYTCAAPFGTGYFFSCRAVYVPALVRLWHILASLVFLIVVGMLFLKPLGLAFTCIALLTFPFAVVGVFQNASSSALSDLDSFILKIPVISPIYEDWFREDTYYRQDTRAFYLTRFPALIKELAEEVTAANGAKLVKSQQAPILRDVNKALPPPDLAAK